MSFPCLRLAEGLPPPDDILARICADTRPTVAARMAEAGAAGRTIVQPRCGVGGLEEMRTLLMALEAGASPEVLTLTIDSHTRLERFDRAAQILAEDPARLNGFPLVAHGHRAARSLAEAIDAPLQVRHGSHDGRRLFAETLAAGLTSFEGGPIGYNLPYCRDVPLRQSIAAWAEIDEAAAIVTAAGVPVEREMFGSLTGVAVPPSIALACTFIEAVLAARAGVRSISIAIPQGGNMVQDIAALQAIPLLAARWLPPTTVVHPVLHQFMGVFPRQRASADGLIFSGGLAAFYGGAHKVICKTYQEAHGVPTAEANVAGLRLTRAALSGRLAWLPLPDAEVAAEREQILAETTEMVEPVLEQADLVEAVVDAFASGRLDIPFPANPVARGQIYPVRDAAGAIRFGMTGNLPFSDRTRRGATRGVAGPDGSLGDAVREALFHFSTLGA